MTKVDHRSVITTSLNITRLSLTLSGFLLAVVTFFQNDFFRLYIRKLFLVTAILQIFGIEI